MTLVAGLLRLLESPSREPDWGDKHPLMARQGENARPVERLVVEITSDQRVADLRVHDCAILPGGECYWREPDSDAVRLALIADRGGALDQEQARALLLVIRSLHKNRGLGLAQVAFGSADLSSDRPAAKLALSVRELFDKKGIGPTK